MCHFYLFPGVPKQCFLVFEGFRENKNRQSFVDERDKGTQVVCEGGLEWRQQEFIVLWENQDKEEINLNSSLIKKK